MISSMLVALAWLCCQVSATPQPPPTEWTRLPDLPDAVGVAGPCVGTHGGALLVAGGANFPDGMPWRGGVKHYEDRIHVLPGPNATWLTLTRRLPERVAYAVSVTTDGGIICAGGRDTERCSSAVMRLRWNAASQDVEIEALPLLPVPLAHAGGALLDDVVYVFGGQEAADGSPGRQAFALDLGARELAWRVLPDMPGPRRGLAVVAAAAGALWVFSGRDYGPERADASAPFAFHEDVLRFDPAVEAWSRSGPILVEGDAAPRCVMAGAAITSGVGRVLLLGGADGSGMRMIDRLKGDARIEFLENHPGFARDVLAFDCETRRFTRFTELPRPWRMPVTTTAVWFDDCIVLPSGEVSPGVRSPAVHSLNPRARVSRGERVPTAVWIGLVVVAWIAARIVVSRRRSARGESA